MSRSRVYPLSSAALSTHVSPTAELDCAVATSDDGAAGPLPPVVVAEAMFEYADGVAPFMAFTR